MSKSTVRDFWQAQHNNSFNASANSIAFIVNCLFSAARHARLIRALGIASFVSQLI
jgi:hypothetical protein